ncbi:hypothetical protein B0A49_08650 [Cryomyces minteri]|uniref:Enoyl reductase (ER) domain-containing protein n=1 Tax=Cryomyces minteri TaxID=331657 RepID=A0A4U0WU38_9PEZI|nr:hypothetical protein B0A49_08650 [Cryomyces minteri]
MSSQQYSGKAIVSHGPHKQGKWRIEDITLRPIAETELVIEVIASGICHTDIHFGNQEAGNVGVFYPRVLGHEGAGYVKAVGSKVTVAQPGDPVLLSFASCSKCHSCNTGHPAYCTDFNDINFFGGNDFVLSSSVSSDASDVKHDIGGRFFGQSSFANVTIANERSVVNVKGLIKDKEELKLFAPLGCGIQTGSGTIATVAGATEKDAVAVLGLGGVGLSAIMAARLLKCKIIIGIDRVDGRLELAKSLGATHTINSSTLPSGKSLGDAVREASDGIGPSISIDTTGVAALTRQAVDFTRNQGKIIQVGTAPIEATLDIPLFMFMITGKQFMGAIEGDSQPTKFVPQMIKWYQEGKLPVNKLVKYFKAEDLAKAIEEMHTGETVKPIIVW